MCLCKTITLWLIKPTTLPLSYLKIKILSYHQISSQCSNLSDYFTILFFRLIDLKEGPKKVCMSHFVHRTQSLFQSVGFPIPLIVAFLFCFFPCSVYVKRKAGGFSCKAFCILNFAACKIFKHTVCVHLPTVCPANW